jgi:hypothetical protein
MTASQQGNYIYYGKNKGGKEVFVTGTDKSDDLNIDHAWEALNTKFEPSLSHNSGSFKRINASPCDTNLIPRTQCD